MLTARTSCLKVGLLPAVLLGMPLLPKPHLLNILNPGGLPPVFPQSRDKASTALAPWGASPYSFWIYSPLYDLSWCLLAFLRLVLPTFITFQTHFGIWRFYWFSDFVENTNYFLHFLHSLVFWMISRKRRIIFIFVGHTGNVSFFIFS